MEIAAWLVHNRMMPLEVLVNLSTSCMEIEVVGIISCALERHALARYSLRILCVTSVATLL